LSAGDWQVCGSVSFNPAGTTTVTTVLAASSSTTATLPTDPDESFGGFNASFTTGVRQRVIVGCKRYSLSGAANVFIVAQAGFGVSTMTADGVLIARRMR